MESPALRIPPRPPRKPFQLKKFRANLPSAGGVIPKKPNPTIPHPIEGKENLETTNFLEEMKHLPSEEFVGAERLRQDMERADAAFKEMDESFERWIRDSERRLEDFVAAEMEIWRIVMATERHSSFLGHWGTTQPGRLLSPISWCPPPPGWVKFNVDGSLTSSGLAGLGMVARDERGAIIFAAGTSMPHWDPGGVEMAAILALKDLIVPSFFGIRGAIVEGDCRTLMDSCAAGVRRGDWRVTVDDTEDFSFLSGFPQLRFQHIGRVANRVADFCARFALRGNFVWLDVDSTQTEFAELVRADLDGML